MTTLTTAARGLAGLFSCTAAIPSFENADELALWVENVEPAPQLLRLPDDSVIPHRVAPSVRGQESEKLRFAYSWANWLGRRGFRDPDLLRIRVRWWKNLIIAHASDLIVADYAPCALLAAHCLGIPAIATGTALSVPPAHLPRLPEFMQSPGDVVLDQDEMVATINDALVPMGLTPLDRLAQIYDCTQPMPRSVSILDPYEQWRTGSRVLPLEKIPPMSAGKGDEVFVYFSTEELQDEGILAALETLPLVARLVAPGLSEGVSARLRKGNPHLKIETRLVPHGEIVSRARVIVCAGQAGTATLSLLSGIPLLALPLHAEQGLNARGASTSRSCRALFPMERTAQAISASILELWESTDLQFAAIEHAAQLRAEFKEGAIESFRWAGQGV